MWKNWRETGIIIWFPPSLRHESENKDELFFGCGMSLLKSLREVKLSVAQVHCLIQTKDNPLRRIFPWSTAKVLFAKNKGSRFKTRSACVKSPTYVAIVQEE